MESAAVISLGEVAGILVTATAIAAEGDLAWCECSQVQAEVSRLDVATHNTKRMRPQSSRF